MKDLIVLTADKNARFVLNTLLSRTDDFGIGQFTYDVFSHPRCDPGVYKEAHRFLRNFLGKYRFAMVFLDKEGCGKENVKSITKITNEIQTNLRINGWEDKNAVIIFDPELEIWAWGDLPCMANIIGWNDYSGLRESVIDKKFWNKKDIKPSRPKEALMYALKKKSIPKSSSLYSKMAEKINFKSCSDKSFVSFCQTLQNWFPHPNVNNILT